MSSLSFRGETTSHLFLRRVGALAFGVKGGSVVIPKGVLDFLKKLFLGFGWSRELKLLFNGFGYFVVLMVATQC